jgi:hypothetical protein
VKAGIQLNAYTFWIPASAGMKDRFLLNRSV